MVFSLTILLISNSSALRINEIESNPEGEDSGFEWIEFYSEDSMNFEGYSLNHEGRGAIINLTGTFSGFFVFNLQTQWLRNSNETVYLKLNGEIVQTIGPFTDNKVNKTYNFCDGGWNFASETKNAENSCESSNQIVNVKNEEEEEENKSKENKKEKIEDVELNISKLENIPDKLNKISLNKKDEVAQEITRTYKTRVGVIYFFIGFCIFIIILMALKKL